MFTDITSTVLCLLCGANVALIKEYNPRWHYKTKHQDNLKNLIAVQKRKRMGCFDLNLYYLYYYHILNLCNFDWRYFYGEQIKLQIKFKCTYFGLIPCPVCFNSYFHSKNVFF